MSTTTRADVKIASPSSAAMWAFVCLLTVVLLATIVASPLVMLWAAFGTKYIGRLPDGEQYTCTRFEFRFNGRTIIVDDPNNHMQWVSTMPDSITVAERSRLIVYNRPAPIIKSWADSMQPVHGQLRHKGYMGVSDDGPHFYVDSTGIVQEDQTELLNFYDERSSVKQSAKARSQIPSPSVQHLEHSLQLLEQGRVFIGDDRYGPPNQLDRFVPSLFDRIPGLAAAKGDDEEIETLLGAIDDPPLVVGEKEVSIAIRALREYDGLPDRAVSVMTDYIGSEDGDDWTILGKMSACEVLGSMGERSSHASPTLNDLLPLADSSRDLERWLSLHAAEAIWRITSARKPAVEVASDFLDDSQFPLAMNSLNLLLRVDPEGRVAKRRLREVLGHQEEDASRAVDEAFWELDETVPEIPPALADEVLQRLRRKQP